MASGELIRVVRSAERQALLALWVELIEHHRKLDPDYPPPSRSEAGIREALLAEIDRALTDPRYLILVAETGAEDLEGFCSAELEPGAIASIHELFVRPGQRRRGLGRALVEATLDRLAERRPARISVRIEAANTEAHGFWTALEFHERARILERKIR